VKTAEEVARRVVHGDWTDNCGSLWPDGVTCDGCKDAEAFISRYADDRAREAFEAGVDMAWDWAERLMVRQPTYDDWRRDDT
jgi:hypothetical protein